jgi:hypothetical protein
LRLVELYSVITVVELIRQDVFRMDSEQGCRPDTFATVLVFNKVKVHSFQLRYFMVHTKLATPVNIAEVIADILSAEVEQVSLSPLRFHSN